MFQYFFNMYVILDFTEVLEAHLGALEANDCTWSEVEASWQKTSVYRIEDIKTLKATDEILKKMALLY